ncbi:uncharacterized protein A1O5_01077, partial [Cladophialophora psammophila CBS 110553]
AYVRKTNPRFIKSTNNPAGARARIVRTGVPHGPEFTDKTRRQAWSPLCMLSEPLWERVSVCL